MSATPAPRSRAAARLRPAVRRPVSNWPWFVLVALLIGYWCFVRYWARVDGVVVLASIFLPDMPISQVEGVYYFSPWAVWLVEMFHPRVLRHFIPIIAGWWLAVQAAISLMQVLYNCPDRKTAAEFLRRQRRNRLSATDELYEVTPQNLLNVREKSVLLRVGGPVLVAIPNGVAAVTERNARFLRVLPPGVHFLGRFEYLYGVVDLHPQTRTATDVLLLTKEGIPVRADVGLTFRIDPGDDPVTQRRPFPFRPEAVRRAAYSGTVGANGRAGSWADGPLGKVRGALAGMVSEQSLDELVAAPAPHDAHHVLTNAVMRRVWDGLPNDGIKPMRMQISRLAPPEEASRQYTDYWLANQRRADQLARANGQAPLMHEKLTAQADAEIAMIRAVADGVRRAQDEGVGTILSGYVLAARLLEALRRMFALSANDLEGVGGDAALLLLEAHALDERLADLGRELETPPPSRPTFNPSKND